MRQLRVVGPVLLAALLAACNPDIVNAPFQGYRVQLWGPDLAQGGENPFDPRLIAKYEVRVSYFEDAAGKMPYGSSLAEKPETFGDFSPVQVFRVNAARTQAFSLSEDGGAVALPMLSEHQKSVFVRTEILGLDSSERPEARARCPLQELRSTSLAGETPVVCHAFFGFIGRWNPVRAPNQPRYDFAAAALPGNRVIVAGGRKANDPAAPPLASVEIFDPFSSPGDAEYGEWAGGLSLEGARFGLTGTATETGYVVFAGGQESDTQFSRAYDVYSAVSGGMLPLTWSLPSARGLHAAALLGPDTVGIFHGRSASSTPDASADFLSPEGKPASGRNVSARFRTTSPCAARVESDLVLVCGGAEDGQSGAMAASGCDLFNASQGYRSYVAPASATSPLRADVKCAAVNGQAFLVGGELDPLSAEIDSWKNDGSSSLKTFAAAPVALSGHALAASNGKVVVSGGVEAGKAEPRNATFLIDPEGAAGKRVLVDAKYAMKSARRRHQLVALPDDTVMAVGGQGAVGAPPPGAEIFVVPD